jgi:hypothetical protein
VAITATSDHHASQDRASGPLVEGFFVHRAPYRQIEDRRICTGLERQYNHITIVGGPTCADEWSWWEVRIESGAAGWVAEGGDEVDPYYVCPAR